MSAITLTSLLFIQPGIAGQFVQFVAHRIIAATHVRPPDNVGQGGVYPPSRLRVVCQEAGELGAGIV